MLVKTKPPELLFTQERLAEEIPSHSSQKQQQKPMQNWSPTSSLDKMATSLLPAPSSQV